jgi:peptide methionine sulfoxide reductase MsrA
MIIKEIIRNIPENREDSSERYRIQYKDKNEFDLLVVTTINRLKTFYKSEKYLNKTRNNIKAVTRTGLAINK